MEVTGAVSPAGVDVQVNLAVPTPEGIFAQSPAALAALKSYRYTTVFSFTGEVDGEPESGSIEMRGSVAGPDRQTAAWKDLESGEEFGIVRVGDKAWMQEGEEWSLVPTMVADALSQAVLVFAPSMSWGGLAEGMEGTSTYVGTETVNGVPARHYTSTYQGWSVRWQGEVRDAAADVWIAEAGYPVRYRFTATGIDEEGYKGSVLWTMELSDVNGPVTIEAPQETGDAVPGSP